MKSYITTTLLLIILSRTAFGACPSNNAPEATQSAIVNGIPWYDEQGNIINSHGSCIVYDNGRYWLFGEYKSDTSNAFPGFGCYSSADLVNWRFERVVLKVQTDGLMGPQRVGERPKVMRCPRTGKYVMLMHSDDLRYCDQYTCMAIADSINGNYQFLGPITYHGEPVRRWDIGAFQDYDGTGYLLAHHGGIYRLADDYMSIDTLFLDEELKQSGESPAMFHRGDTYYLLTSNLTSWERNDNFYFTATSPKGPWRRHGVFCPEGTLTWNSQCTFVLPIVHDSDTTFMYMGDRWSYPHQASCATQVWLPLRFEGDSLSIPQYWQAWDPKSVCPIDMTASKKIVDHFWRSDHVGDSTIIRFTGQRITIFGATDRHSAYGHLRLTAANNHVVIDMPLDFYSLVPANGILWQSPKLSPGTYTLSLTVSSDQPIWFDKKRHCYGTDGHVVTTHSYMIE